MGKHIWFQLVLCLIAIILGLLVLDGSKIAFGAISLIFLAFLSGAMIFRAGLEKIEKYIMYFIVASIPFPYLLQFSGKDALTVTTVIICFLSAVMILRRIPEKKNFSPKPKFSASNTFYLF